ncbi:MAG: hypothetical protein HQ553_11905 [Chloroflexi bacterium]|nr:hypothetical protein [Chloroflexota bacterium]
MPHGIALGVTDRTECHAQCFGGHRPTDEDNLTSKTGAALANGDQASLFGYQPLASAIPSTTP